MHKNVRLPIAYHVIGLPAIETHKTCDFPGGSGPPDPPLDPHLLSRSAGDSFFPLSRRWVVPPPPPPPWKITSYMGFFGHPHPLEEVGPPPPLCNKTIGSTL